MAKINQLTKEQLKDPSIFQLIEKRVEEIIWFNETTKARDLANKIEEQLKKSPELIASSPEIYQQYQDLIIKLEFMSLPTLTDERVFELIKKHLISALKSNIDLNQRIALNIFSRPVFVRGEFKKRARQALKENRQKIGGQSLTIKGKPTPQPPTLKNWLLDYDQTMGIKKHSELEREQYLAQNPNVRKLASVEKDLLRKVLKFYDNLKPTPVSQVAKWIKTARDKGLIPPLEESELEAVSPTLPPGAPPETLPPRPKTAPPLTPRPLADRPAPPSTARPAPSAVQPSPVRPLPPSPPEPAEPEPSRRDIYQEPVGEPPEPGQVEPKIEGNVVDLKNK
ncbi:MAG: hypothetical protein ISS88_00365 [Candidatus Portnoybacteria bacterium]|nr:hypothetical protein [Candidatus Portnoybacteria bacterium]